MFLTSKHTYRINDDTHYLTIINFKEIAMNAIRCTGAGVAFICAIAAGHAGAQQVINTQAYFNDALEVAMPPDGTTTTLPLTGLKSAHAAWVTFIKFTEGKPVDDAQVMSIMQGVTVKWAGTRDNCIYELRLVPSPPALTINKTSGMCNLKPPGNAVFRVLAM